jgi:hypothetical protein
MVEKFNSSRDSMVGGPLGPGTSLIGIIYGTRA